MDKPEAAIFIPQNVVQIHKSAATANVVNFAIRNLYFRAHFGNNIRAIRLPIEIGHLKRMRKR